MRILSRYVLKEVISHAAIGTAVFTFVVFMRDVSRILELLVRNSAPLPSVAEIFFLTLPTALTVTIPMGVLVGILIGLSRLAADSEITAIRASGIGAVRFVLMISSFAIVAWLLALGNSLYLAPRSAAELIKLQNSLKNAQISFEVQPRVFYENFNNFVLYVQDTHATRGAAVWKDVFLADISDPSAPKITLAKSAIVSPEDENTVRLHLEDGTQHETAPRQPDQYDITTFHETDLPLSAPSTEQQPRRMDSPAQEMDTRALIAASRDGDKARSRWFSIELQRRFSYPTACLVLALIGVPLGLSSKKGGKSTGFVLTVVLVFVFYFVSLFGVALGRQGKMPPALGAWIANILFAIAGMYLLWRVDRAGIEIGSIRAAIGWLQDIWQERVRRRPRAVREERADASSASGRYRFPAILDNYILRTFFFYLWLILLSFLVLTNVFNFFELLGDIVRNRVPLVTVGAYLVNVTPSMIYLFTPLCVLLAVLITFGLMQRSNEMTAMKATGISIYRAIIPVLVVSAVLAGALFFFDQTYLPGANTRQEALRNSIKGKPAQTFVRPDRKWIFGQHNTIYYYEHFDAEQNVFASLTAFSFDPESFQITRRIYSDHAHWDEHLKKWIFEQGGVREFDGDQIKDFRQFDVATFADLTEPPPYFKKEVKQSSEMNFTELTRYIKDLQQSGFEVVALRVQLYKKLAFPLITFVMAVLAVPFALSAGRRGALTGVAAALVIAMVYWITSGFFEQLGNFHQMPAALAAWAPDVLFGLIGGYFILRVET